jgi:triosephosphate isomerase
MRKPVIAANWKNVQDTVATRSRRVALKPLVANANHCEVVIAPVFHCLRVVAIVLEGSNIKSRRRTARPNIAEGRIHW